MRKIIIILLFVFLISCTSNKNTNNKVREINEIKIKVITFVPHKVLDAVTNSTVQSLIEKYNVSKNNIQIFNPNGNLDEVRTFVRTLNPNNTDVIVSVSTPTTQAVLSVRHPSIPLVFSFVSDTLALNLPAYNNVTGISNVLNYKKGFDLLRELIPDLSTICVVYNPSEPNSYYSYKQIVKCANMQNPPVKIVNRQFSDINEISVIAATVNGVDAYYVGGDNTLVSNIKSLLNVANNKKIPVFASDEGSVTDGAIGAFSINYDRFGVETSDLIYSVIKNNLNCKGIKIIAHDKGDKVLNQDVINKFGIDISKIKNYRFINGN